MNGVKKSANQSQCLSTEDSSGTQCAAYIFLNIESQALLILELCSLRKPCNLTLTHRTENKMSSDYRTMRLWASKSLNQSERRSPHCWLGPSPACSCQIILGSGCLIRQSGKNRLSFTLWKKGLSFTLMFVHMPWGGWWGARIFKNHQWMHTVATCNHDKASNSGISVVF